MLRILTKRDHLSPIYEEMLLGRARVFRDRMKWNVEVRGGKEIDWYDQNADPIYIVSLNEAGSVVGSLRLLPATGPTMLRREFRSFFPEPIIVDGPMTWECTRFCVHPASPAAAVRVTNVSGQLLSGLCDLALKSGIESVVGIYARPMERVYRQLGWPPKRLSMSLPRFGRICCGSWEVSESISSNLRRRAQALAVNTIQIIL